MSSQKHRDKDEGRGDSDFDRICNPITRLRLWLKSKVFWEAWKFYIFLFLPGRLTLHPMQVKGWIWNWFHNALGKISQETQWYVPREKKIVFFPLLFIINYRCADEGFAWDWDESWPLFSQLERLLQGWSLQWACLLTLSELFFSTCWGAGMERCVSKGGIVLKPVGWPWTRLPRLTVWSLVTSGQALAGPCRLATQRCLMENSLLRWFNQG